MRISQCAKLKKKKPKKTGKASPLWVVYISHIHNPEAGILVMVAMTTVYKQRKCFVVG